MIWGRKTPRLREYDYSHPGAYFVTVCAKDRQSLFGAILNGEMQLNPAGLMVQNWWKKLESNFPTIKTDFYVVMPNHFHGIVLISELPGTSLEGGHMGPPLQKVVQWFKTMSTNEYIHGVKEHGWRPFQGHLWPRSFYKHVIRDETSLNRIREYIIHNPSRWHLDRENPQAQGKDDFDRWLASFTSKSVPGNCRGGPMCPPTDARRR